jgi:site-specific recombinase XerD
MAHKLASRAGNYLDDERAAESFSLSLLAAGRKALTDLTYQKALKRLSDFTHDRGMPSVAYLSTEHLREYFKELYTQGWQASTVSVHYRALAQFYKWAVGEGERRDNPLDRIPPPKLEEKIQPHYSLADVAAVLKRLPPHSRDWRILRNRAIVLTLYDTGLRGAELCGVKRQDTDLRGLSLRVERGKGGKWREVAIGPVTAQAIDRYLRYRKDLAPWLFLGRAGDALTTNGLRMFLERLWKDAGMDFKGVHAFRRGFAIQFLENGGDPEDLRALAGWESPQMLRRYTKATETQRARRAHAKYSPVQGLSLGR